MRFNLRGVILCVGWSIPGFFAGRYLGEPLLDWLDPQFSYWIVFAILCWIGAVVTANTGIFLVALFASITAGVAVFGAVDFALVVIGTSPLIGMFFLSLWAIDMIEIAIMDWKDKRSHQQAI